MIQLRFVKMFVCLYLIIGSSIYAAEASVEASPVSSEPTHARWVFSGVVINESGENYGYFFQMQRDADQFKSIAALFDGQSKKMILFDESEAILHEVTPNNWHVGRAFLRHNAINDSWIFGVKTKEKKGFNFKIDMQKQVDATPMIQHLSPGVVLLVHQTSHLNGHVQASNDSKEQFVTGKNAWFRQIWLTKHQDNSHPYTGVLCRFNDGRGFYSLKMSEPEALRGAVAGWCDEQGVASVVSQFINVKQEANGPWHIRIPSPSLHLILSDFTKQHSVVAGFLAEGKNAGFCMLSQESIGGGTAEQA